MQLANKVFRQR